MAAWESGASFSRFNEQVEPSENGRRQLLFGSGLQGDLQHGRFQLEPDSGPNDGERTIFVSDDGLLDTGEYDELSAEFRHRLGLLPEEEQELSEVFKVRIGLASADRDQFDRLADEIDRAMTDKDESNRTETIQRNNMEQFRRKYFQRGSPPLQYSQTPLKRPLLPKTTDVEKRASLAIWIAINRFMDGVSQRKASNPSKVLEAPIISRVWDQLETLPVPVTETSSVTSTSSKRHSTVGPSSSSRVKTQTSSSMSKRLSLKKLFRSQSSTAYSVNTTSVSGGSDFVRPPLSRTISEVESISGDDGEPQEDNTGLLTSEVVKSIPNTELDLVNFIVAHGILRKDLRDEIYSQLCCQVTNNNSPESRRRAWILHALCAGCFLPSIKMCSYYYGFLHNVLHDTQLTEKLYYAAYTRRILRRTNANGTRFHPPSAIELSALKEQKSVVIEVSVADGRQLRIEADSATTSSEVCTTIAGMIQIKDGFGFALFVNINGNVSSMGNGLDHVLDAVTECEQLARSQGRLESTAHWKLMYRKEVFTPWYSPSNDPMGTELIYRQIVNGVHNSEYKLHSDDIITFVSRCLYVERGRQVNIDFVKSRMSEYFPKSFFSKDSNNNKSRDSLAKVVMAAFEKQGFSGYAVPAKFIQQEIVASASSIWPIHFSAIFEAYRIEGPQLPHNELIIAINSSGIFLMSVMYEVIVGFHYYDIASVNASKSNDSQKPTIQLRSIDNIEFKFLSPNAETVARIVTVFLDGLRRRSRWAIAVRPIRRSDSTQLSMKPRDLIEILETVTSPSSSSRSPKDEFFKGRNERTGEKGKLASSCVYVIPTTDKPTPEFMAVMAPHICNRFADDEGSDTETVQETSEEPDDDVDDGEPEIAITTESSRFDGEDLVSDSMA